MGIELKYQDKVSNVSKVRMENAMQTQDLFAVSLDVQGMEPQILSGFGRLRAKIILFEVSSPPLSDEEGLALFRDLEERGFVLLDFGVVGYKTGRGGSPWADMLSGDIVQPGDIYRKRSTAVEDWLPSFLT